VIELGKDIDDIRRMLKANLFQDEQHVRFSLVGRICQSLGWNIWDPSEFYTEYKVKKIPPKNLSKDVTGKVDIALFIPEKTSEGAEVFIEVKTAGRLEYEMVSGELQLLTYNTYHKSAISILTDGIQWRFYLPTAGGDFDDRLFNELNLRDDDPDEVCRVFEQVLKKDNFRKKAVDTAEAMRKERKKIISINLIKDDAGIIAEKLDQPIHIIAQRLLKTKYKLSMPLEEIEALWERTIPGSSKLSTPSPDIKAPTTPDPPKGRNGLPPKPADIYTFKKVKRVFVIDGWHEAKNWGDVKVIVYNRLLDGLKSGNLSKTYGVSQDPKIYRRPASLRDGYYTDLNLSSYNVVWHCHVALYSLGYDPIKDLKIEMEGNNESHERS